jgi:general secretion pathway protein A
MYCRFFGFSEKPFKATPDPRFLFLSENHEEALRAIICGIHERAGVLSMTGEVGTGKTTVLRAAQDWLGGNTRTAYVSNFALEFDDLLTSVLAELDLAKTGEKISRAEAVDRLKHFCLGQFSLGGTVALVIDEAQNLAAGDLERLRLLSNLETSREKLVQIILSGQPELDRRLDAPGLRQLKQRLWRRIRIKALDRDATSAYLRHRLKVVGGANGALLDAAASEEIWRHTAGVPRKINVLCDNSLRSAFERNVRRLNPGIIRSVARELGWC